MIANLQDANDLNVSSYSYYDEVGSECIVSLKNGITEIRYHYPIGEGDKHFVDVYQNGKLAWRDLNVSSVTFSQMDGKAKEA